jgi:hypothetical protein
MWIGWAQPTDWLLMHKVLMTGVLVWVLGRKELENGWVFFRNDLLQDC